MSRTKPRNAKRNHTGHIIGEWHPKAKLTDKDVRRIRKEYVPGVMGYKRLADKYGCGESTVRDIVKYRTRWDA